MDGHEEFRELCAISVSDELTREQKARLCEHLRTCPWCEKVFHQYRATVVGVLPQLAAEGVPSEWSPESSGAAEKAEAVFFERLKARGSDEWSPRPCLSESTDAARRIGNVPSPARWAPFGMLYAAGILLFLSLTVASYRLGNQRGARTVAESPANNNDTSRMLLDDDHDRPPAELVKRDKTISALTQ